MEHLLTNIIATLSDAMLGGAGGLVIYLYHFAQSKKKDKSTKMEWEVFLINGVVGGFMAFTLGGLIPEDLSYRDGILGLVGVCGFGLIGIVESKFADEIFKKFMK